ncbi:hypothetical protein ABWL39_03460 [Chitinivorax sp. PXF-14]|uniref:hypothetical protein n=1 Tax=Chitinivorax sp. PXF-14 TaxID=3230488 RepID=UPI0034657A40
MKIITSCFLALLCSAPPALADSFDPRLADQTFVDMRYKHRDIVRQYAMDFAVLRFENIRTVGGDWHLWSRLELNGVSTNLPAADNRLSQWHTGAGDTLAHLALLTSVAPGTRIGFGVQVGLPTANRDSLGYGRYVVAPAAAVEQDLPIGERGSFVGIIVREQYDVGGDTSRGKIRMGIYQPTLHYRLPAGYFIELNPEARYNRRANDTWFTSMAVSAGRYFADRSALQFSFARQTQDDYLVFEREFELRYAKWF